MKRKIIFRTFPFNEVSFPTLLYQWEKIGLDNFFDIIIFKEDNIEKLDFDINDFVLYSYMTPHIPIIAEEIKKLKGKVTLVCGGPDPSYNIDFSKKIGFDIVFSGSGEKTFVSFGYDILENRVKDSYIDYELDSINDSYPISKYYNFVPFLEIVRGCRWKCKYCQTGRSKVIYRDLKSIIKYFDYLKNNGKKRVSFISPSAFEYFLENNRISLDKIKEFIDLINSYHFDMVEYGIFPSEIRPETVSKEILDIISKYVTHKKLTIGCQSASPVRLKELSRAHTIYDVLNAIEIINQFNFKVNIDLILGFPDETDDEFYENINFINSVTKKYNAIFQLHYFFPLSGSIYENRLPVYYNEKKINILTDLYKAGKVTKWFINDFINMKNYFEYIKTHYFDFYEKYY